MNVSYVTKKQTAFSRKVFAVMAMIFLKGTFSIWIERKKMIGRPRRM